MRHDDDDTPTTTYDVATIIELGMTLFIVAIAFGVPLTIAARVVTGTWIGMLIGFVTNQRYRRTDPRTRAPWRFP